MSGRGADNRGNNRRRPFKHRDKDTDTSSSNVYTGQDSSRQGAKKNDPHAGRDLARYEKNRGGLFERPRWVPPVLSADPLPVPDCPYCGKPIKDISAAVADKGTGEPVHFDCIIARIAEGETLETGDTVTYIGGGRFGVVHFDNPAESKNFTIKKILEWEDKEHRAEWRDSISDHYSVT